MTNRERVRAVLHYEPYDRLPVVHFGFWGDILQTWAAEGHLTEAQAKGWADGSPADDEVTAALGFDLNWQSVFRPSSGLNPGFESKVLRVDPDGTRHVLNYLGVVHVEKPGAGSIPASEDHMLKDRASWEEHFKWRLEWSEERINATRVRVGGEYKRFDQGGMEALRERKDDRVLGLHCGSLYGDVRNLLGMEGACYLQVDDEALFDEIVNTIADLCYRNTAYVLERCDNFDFAHFWEDICYKNGPLITPSVFEAKIGPHYRRITELVRSHGIDIVSLDCDGMIDALIPTWIGNGVNTMFPIEVGTWNASIAPWRERYGRELLGVGGTDKRVFARDRAAVDAEVERLKPLVELGGYIPCPDHRLPPDCKWDLVRHYCDRLREEFVI